MNPNHYCYASRNSALPDHAHPFAFQAKEDKKEQEPAESNVPQKKRPVKMWDFKPGTVVHSPSGYNIEIIDSNRGVLSPEKATAAFR